MKYKFIRYKYIDEKGKSMISDWMFVQETAEQVYDFFMKYTMTQHDTHKEKIIDNLNIESHKRYAEQIHTYNNHFTMYGGHPRPTSHWECAHSAYMARLNDTEKNLKEAIPGIYDLMTAQMLTTRLDMVKKGYVSYIGKEGMVSRILSDVEIVDTRESDELEFPNDTNYSIEDVKFLQWPSGKHWYAKINGEDIVINGVQKWNTKEEAISAAELYIKNFLNS